MMKNILLLICFFMLSCSSKEIGKTGEIVVYDTQKAHSFKDIMDVPVPPVTPDPDPETVSVDLTVSIGQWTVVQVKPEV